MSARNALIYDMLLLVALVVVLSVGYLLYAIVFPQYVCDEVWVVSSLYLIIYYALFAFMLTPRLNEKLFFKRFMLFRVLKILLLIAAMIVVVMVFKHRAKELLIAFLLFYMTMLVPETIYTIYLKKRVNKANV